MRYLAVLFLVYYNLFKLGVFKKISFNKIKLNSGQKALTKIHFDKNGIVNDICINIDLNKTDACTTIKHECRHVWQCYVINHKTYRFLDYYAREYNHRNPLRQLIALHEMDAIAYSKGKIGSHDKSLISELNYEQLCSFESFRDIDLKFFQIMESYGLRTVIESEALADGILLRLAYV